MTYQKYHKIQKEDQWINNCIDTGKIQQNKDDI